MKLRTRRRNAMKSPARVWASTTGPRCPTFSVGCITCASWHHLDMRGFFPRSFEDAHQYDERLVAMHGYETDGVEWADAGKYGPDTYNRETDLKMEKLLKGST